jgi:hypothetical protein
MSTASHEKETGRYKAEDNGDGDKQPFDVNKV